VEALFRRERLILVGCLAAMVLLSWAYLIDMAIDMSGMSMADMPGMAMAGMTQLEPWTLRDVTLLFVMWAVMMVAMMVPSAAPMALAFLKVNQGRRRTSRPVVGTWVFVLGYIAMWSAYSLVAAVAQWGLHEAAVISPAMVVTSPYVGGAILIVAGIFQWTPLKYTCLEGCRSPLSFLMSEWREGARGAFVMGLRHGSYCVGCCWALMALLFVSGVMNLVWVAIISAFVMAEKLLPRGEILARVAGLLFMVLGVARMVGFR